MTAGRDAPGAAGAPVPARHGLAPRGQRQPPGEGGGRFGRMFPSLSAGEVDAAALEALVAHMAGRPRSENNDDIPAGYTYLGQFVDHDITFDPTSQLQRANDPDALVNFRTPRLDLDSLYGAGPAGQPYLYDWDRTPHPGVHLLVGGARGDGGLAPVDLPRNEQGRALLGDPRNDENLIVAQLHLLFIRFHNRVVDHVAAAAPRLAGAELLGEAQRLVRWHYQWIVTHDFLRRIAGPEMARGVLVPDPDGAGARAERRFYRWEDQPYMPVEFSGAAYRFGHSLVRDTYRINDAADGVPIFAPAGDDDARHLGGERRLPADLVIGWEHFFPTSVATTPERTLRIDERLTEALSRVPPHGASLARLNLQRGRALGLPAGADVARHMGVAVLTEQELFLDDATAQAMPATARKALWRGTPLWYYVLCEAKKSGPAGGNGGMHLGPVGGRIVAEVLVGLLEADPHSYLSQAPAWTPELPGSDGDFTMADLVRFTLGRVGAVSAR